MLQSAASESVQILDNLSRVCRTRYQCPPMSPSYVQEAKALILLRGTKAGEWPRVCRGSVERERVAWPLCQTAGAYSPSQVWQRPVGGPCACELACNSWCQQFCLPALAATCCSKAHPCICSPLPLCSRPYHVPPCPAPTCPSVACRAGPGPALWAWHAAGAPALPFVQRACPLVRSSLPQGGWAGTCKPTPLPVRVAAARTVPAGQNSGYAVCQQGTPSIHYCHSLISPAGSIDLVEMMTSHDPCITVVKTLHWPPQNLRWHVHCTSLLAGLLHFSQMSTIRPPCSTCVWLAGVSGASGLHCGL